MTKIIDLTNKRFGKLVVLELFEKRKVKNSTASVLYWKCLCDCGNEKIIRGADLKFNNIRSCGCLYKERKYENLLGQRFGRWEVIEKVEKPIKLKKYCAYWLCKCDCGETRIIPSKNLKSGTSQSCGCLMIELMRLEDGESSFNKLVAQYKAHAKQRNLDFELNRDEFRNITSKNCFYCGREPFQKSISQSKYGLYIYNGIDRIDNSKGYIIGNVVPCCGQCNWSKVDMPIEDFFKWIDMVYKNIHREEGIYD